MGPLHSALYPVPCLHLHWYTVSLQGYTGRKSELHKHFPGETNEATIPAQLLYAGYIKERSQASPGQTKPGQAMFKKTKPKQARQY